MKRDKGVFKRPGSPYWQIEFWTGGKRHTETSKSLRKSVAQDLLQLRLQEYRLLPGLDRRVTILGVLEEYLRDCEVRGCRGMKDMTYRAKLAADFLGHWRAVDIKAGHIRDLQNHLVNKGYGNGTIIATVGNLKSAMVVAAQQGTIPHVPTFPRGMVRPPPRQGFFEYADFRAVLEELEPWAQDVFRFAYYSGWRKREILTLRWDDVDLEGEVIRLQVTQSKTRKGRVRPIVGGISEVLQDRIRLQRLGVPWVFHREGKPLARSTFDLHFRTACVIAGRSERTLHDSRRTAARDMERAHVPRGVAMALMGHQTSQMYERYNIVSEDELAGAALKHYEYLQEKAKTAEGKVLPFDKRGGTNDRENHGSVQNIEQGSRRAGQRKRQSSG